jgi:type IV pilus assembly protein PilQ
MKKRKQVLLILAILLVAATFAAAQEKTITLDFNDTDIHAVLKAFSRKTGLNVIPEEGVSGKISASISNTRPLEALEALLDIHGLTYSQKGKTILVSSTKTDGNMALRSFTLKYVKAADVKDMLINILEPGLGEGISFSSGLSSITVQAKPKKLRIIAKMIEEIDVPPAQVQVEAKIIEIKSGSGDTADPSVMGVNWKIKNTRDENDYAQLLTTDTLTSGDTSLGLYAQLLSGNVDVYLSALEKSIGYDLVASPWITALNHEEAEILIGSKYGYKTSIVTETSTVQEVNFLEVGTKLKFTPHINEDGYIRMTIYPSISEGSVINELPQENTTETKNEVLVKDGQTIVIGGLTKNYNNQIEIGVPILSHLPFLGILFRRTELKSEKRDIMVLITPHIVTPEFLNQMAERKDLLEKRQKQEAEKAKLIH